MTTLSARASHAQPASSATNPGSQASVSPTAAAFARPVSALLQELAGVLAALDAEKYTQSADDTFFRGTIGGHVRHCLDHARALLDGLESGVVDYDNRVRGSRIETDPVAAREEAHRLQRLAEHAARLAADLPMVVRILPTRDGVAVALTTSLARELAFVLSHTIHHNATIRGMAVAMGVPTPAAFGYAPATLQHLDSAGSERSACAH